MKSVKHLLALVALVQTSQAVTLDFEDLSGGGAVPANYAGLDWSSGWNHYTSADAPYHPSSGSSRVYNEFGNLGVIRFNADVTLHSLWIAGYGYDQYVEGYDDGVKLFESVHMPSGEATFGLLLSLDWSGVDEIRIQSSNWGYNHYILDDLAFSPSVVEERFVQRTSVPDAGGSAAMLGAGVVAVSLIRRRTQRVG